MLCQNCNLEYPDALCGMTEGAFSPTCTICMLRDVNMFHGQPLDTPFCTMLGRQKYLETTDYDSLLGRRNPHRVEIKDMPERRTLSVFVDGNMLGWFDVSTQNEMDRNIKDIVAMWPEKQLGSNLIIGLRPPPMFSKPPEMELRFQ